MSQPVVRLRMDFTRKEVVDTHALPEVASPAAGIWRRMIERDGGEVARATSVVRYAPGTRFPPHTHELGEEFLVLQGSFADEHGTYPAGTYVRNPAGSSHSPFTAVADEGGGCILFVKLRQLDPADQVRLVVDSRARERDGQWGPGAFPGLRNLLLGGFGTERTVLVRWAPGTHIPEHTHASVEETLVLEGEIEDDEGRYPAGTWFRVPTGSTHAPRSPRGALILIRVGHAF